MAEDLKKEGLGEDNGALTTDPTQVGENTKPGEDEEVVQVNKAADGSTPPASDADPKGMRQDANSDKNEGQGYTVSDKGMVPVTEQDGSKPPLAPGTSVDETPDTTDTYVPDEKDPEDEKDGSEDGEEQGEREEEVEDKPQESIDGERP